MQINRPKEMDKSEIVRQEPIAIKAGLLLRLHKEKQVGGSEVQLPVEMPYCYYSALQ